MLVQASALKISSSWLRDDKTLVLNAKKSREREPKDMNYAAVSAIMVDTSMQRQGSQTLTKPFQKLVLMHLKTEAPSSVLCSVEEYQAAVKTSPPAEQRSKTPATWRARQCRPPPPGVARCRPPPSGVAPGRPAGRLLRYST